MADALLAPAVAATMYVASGSAAGVSVHKLRQEEKLGLEATSKRLPAMAVTAALVFAGQMINYTIPGTGSSGHLCGGMMLSAILGPYAGFLSMIAVLVIQCLFFADGGLMALGANIWNMAFYGCFVGYFLIYKPIMNSNLFASKGKDASNRIKLVLASILGCVITLQLGAASVAIETTLSGITSLPFGTFLGLMLPIHLAIGLVEGLITAAVLLFLYEARPELLKEVSTDGDKAGKLSLKSTIAVLAVVALLVGGGLSLAASANPDGLEWALFGNAEEGYAENMGLDEDDFGLSSDVSEKAGEIQESTSFLPDYAFANDEENPLGTTVSGIVGSLIVACLAAVICFVGGFFRRKNAEKAA
jgi:cobalt/nickel transport system permease protein